MILIRHKNMKPADIKDENMEVHILKFSPRIPLLIQKCMNGLYSEIKGQNHSTILQTRGIGLYTTSPHPFEGDNFLPSCDKQKFTPRVRYPF